MLGPEAAIKPRHAALPSSPLLFKPRRALLRHLSRSPRPVASCTMDAGSMDGSSKVVTLAFVDAGSVDESS